ncbi:hypothetical protein RRG08_019579 [Elysia crispata]|uniref:Uncharacterized protein n=1 Tax=Elysia crispata TaxID=231223 RepID=A0AAE0YSD8_9GAST|nr:hypothetical protein RRG08_019579 [Elysia crispata]
MPDPGNITTINRERALGRFIREVHNRLRKSQYQLTMQITSVSDMNVTVMVSISQSHRKTASRPTGVVGDGLSHKTKLKESRSPMNIQQASADWDAIDPAREISVKRTLFPRHRRELTVDERNLGL